MLKNRTLWTDTLGPTSVGYTDNALHQYTAVGAVTPTYDNNGNITSGYGGGLTLTYDCENRLTTAGSVSFGYDLLGRRISRTQSGSTTVYIYDGPHIIAEYSSGSLIRKYIYGPGIDNPVAMIRRTSVDYWYYYYTDVLGSVRLLTNASGAVVESYTYDPYGQPRVMYNVGSISGPGPDGNWLTEDTTTFNGSFLSRGNPILFTGRWWDSTTGLYHYRFRDYSPTLGRFLQPDPIGYTDSMNLYAYCGNNPINWVDPFGLWPGWLDSFFDYLGNLFNPNEEDRNLGTGSGGQTYAGVMGNYIPAPRNPPAGIPGLQRVPPKNPVQGGGHLRARWRDPKGNIYEWDSQHGRLEKYDKRGKHLGEYDPDTGEQTKPRDPNKDLPKCAL